MILELEHPHSLTTRYTTLTRRGGCPRCQGDVLAGSCAQCGWEPTPVPEVIVRERARGQPAAVRQADIAYLVNQGHTTRQIAEELGLSARTVENYRFGRPRL